MEKITCTSQLIVVVGMENECLDYKNLAMFLLCTWGHWSMSVPSIWQFHPYNREKKLSYQALCPGYHCHCDDNTVHWGHCKKKGNIDLIRCKRVHQQPTAVLTIQIPTLCVLNEKDHRPDENWTTERLKLTQQKSQQNFLKKETQLISETGKTLKYYLEFCFSHIWECLLNL